MARNKYPERTVEKILNVAENLFVSKGYSNTSMQDIINALSGDMTKGAIYHHFKSKLDIYAHIVNTRFEGIQGIFEEVLARDNLSGAEKIKTANSMGIASEHQDTILNFMAQVQKSSEGLDTSISAFVIKMAEDKFLPLYTKMVEEGIGDGSIKAQMPDVVAEALVYLIFVWGVCRLTVLEPEDVRKRMDFTGKMFEPFGIELITAEAREIYDTKIAQYYNKK